MARETLQRFLEASRLVLGQAAAVEVAAVAVRSGDGWHLLRGRVLATPWMRDPTDRLVVDLGDVVAVRVVDGPAHLGKVLEALTRLELPIPGWDRGATPALPTRPGLPPSEYADVFRERRRGLDDTGVDWPVHEYVVSTVFDDADDRAVEAARRALASIDPPHANEADLLRALGFQVTSHRDRIRDSRIEVVVPIPARLGSVARVGDELRVVVEHAAVRRAPIAVALIPEAGPRADRQLFTLEPTGGDPGPVAASTVVFRAPSCRGPAHVIVSYDRWACDEQLTGTPNGRAAAHVVLDPEFRHLRDCLNPDKSQKERLEEGVALLLHALGFSAAHYGVKRLNHAPDVIAFAGEQRALVCECSWAPPDPDMIAKAKQRASAVRDALRSVGTTATVVPVVVTSADVTPDPADALSPREQGVALVTRTDLDAWTARALHGEGPDPFWDFVVRLAQPMPDWQNRGHGLTRLLPGLG